MRRKSTISGAICAVAFAAQIFAVNCFQPGLYQGGWAAQPEGAALERLMDEDMLPFPEDLRGVGEGETRLLHEYYIDVAGKVYAPRDQLNAPSCVAQSAATATDFLAAVEIFLGEPERMPPARSSAAVLYGLARQEISDLGPNAGGGAYCLWAVKALKEYGSVASLNYPLLGIDLRQPSPERCVLYGAQGCPDQLEGIARMHPVRDYLAINSYEEARDAIYTGCPLIVGSMQGFGNGRLRRDSEGFLNPPRRVFFPSVWAHAMTVIGVCDEGRKGVLILNSWGTDWISGPKRFESDPDGSFWVDKVIFDGMTKQSDTYALLNFKGYRSFRVFLPNRLKRLNHNTEFQLAP
jgi:hypothetical protein